MPEKAHAELEALGCVTAEQGVCDNGSYYCVARSDPLPGGFRHCVFPHVQAAGDSCPADYPAGPYVFHEYLADNRECACTCGSPRGGECTGFVSIYQDNACSVPVFTDYLIGSTDPGACVDVMSGVALESTEVTNVAYQGGTCQPTGVQVGDVDKAPPFTVCCTPERVIP
jgi:hypothetical protein